LGIQNKYQEKFPSWEGRAALKQARQDGWENFHLYVFKIWPDEIHSCLYILLVMVLLGQDVGLPNLPRPCPANASSDPVKKA